MASPVEFQFRQKRFVVLDRRLLALLELTSRYLTVSYVEDMKKCGMVIMNPAKAEKSTVTQMIRGLCPVLPKYPMNTTMQTWSTSLALCIRPVWELRISNRRSRVRTTPPPYADITI